jgi:hypothetical protein
MDSYGLNSHIMAITISARGNNSRANIPNFTKMTCTPYFVQSKPLTDACKKVHYLLNGQSAQRKRSMSVWEPETKLVSHQFHVMFDDNFDTVQAPDPNITHAYTMDHLFKTNSYKYDDPFGNEHTYLFSHGGVDIHPDNLTPNIETCQESLTVTSTHDEHHSDTQNNTSTLKKHFILGMQYLVILHINNIFPQSSKDDFKAYKHLHGIDMQIPSITKSPKQKAQYMDYLTFMKNNSKSLPWNITQQTLNPITKSTTM